jgi:UrcA family protein
MSHTKFHAIRAITINAAIVLGFSAAAASAASPNTQFVSDGVNQYVVRFPDLDISKIDGAAALYGRLRQAAGIVCGSLQNRDLAMNAQYVACKDHAVAAAVASVGDPMLSQYHESRTKGEKSALIQLAKAN